jgi:hypothetical protein
VGVSFRGRRAALRAIFRKSFRSISALVVEYNVAIDVTRLRFPADAYIRKVERKRYLRFEGLSLGTRRLP